MSLSTATETVQSYALLCCVCAYHSLGPSASASRPDGHAPFRRSRDDHGDGVAIRPAAALADAPAAAGFGGFAVDHAAAARRARAAGQQPGVDARDVEAVPAPRQHTHLLAVRELAEADGAHVLLVPGLLLLLPADVNLHGDAPQRALLDSASDARAGRRTDARRRPLAAAVRGPAPAPQRAPGQRIERDGEQQRQEQRRQEDHRVGVERRVGPRRRRRASATAASTVHGRRPRLRQRWRRRLGVPTVHATSSRARLLLATSPAELCAAAAAMHIRGAIAMHGSGLLRECVCL